MHMVHSICVYTYATDTVLLVILDHELYLLCSFLLCLYTKTHSDNLTISGCNSHLACFESHFELEWLLYVVNYIIVVYVFVCNVTILIIVDTTIGM